MFSTVLKLQRDLLNPQTKLSELLRRAELLAKRTQIKEFKQWIDFELNGYSDFYAIPKYRILKAQLKTENRIYGLIPVIIRDEWLEELLSNARVHESVTELERLLDKNDSNIVLPINPELIDVVKRNYGQSQIPYLVVERSEIIRLLDQVRNTLVQWTLKLEKEGTFCDSMNFGRDEGLRINPSTYNVISYIEQNINIQMYQQTSQTLQELCSRLEFERLGEFCRLLQNHLEQLDLDLNLQAELKIDLETINLQMSSPRPKKSIIQECVESIKMILESVVSTKIDLSFLQKMEGGYGNLHAFKHI